MMETEKGCRTVGGRRQGMVACAICAAIGLAAFAPTLRHGFVYDDHRIVKDNWIVTSPDAWYRFLVTSYWPPRHSGEKRPPTGDILYRPLTIGSFRAEYVLAGASASVHHATNAVLHALASLGVCVVAWRLWASPAAGFTAGALFASHPLHADAVAPIVGRSELLAAVLILWLLARHLGAERLCGKRLVRFHIGSALLFGAAVLAKEHAVLVWPALLLADVWRCRQVDPPARPGWFGWFEHLAQRSHLGFTYAVATFFALRYHVFGELFRKPLHTQPFWANPLAHADLTAHLLTPLRLLALTARLLVDPSRLCPLWGPDGLLPPESIREPDVWLGAALGALLVVLLVRALRRRSPAAVGLAGFAGLMLVPLHVLPLATWFFAERWLYLPSAFLLTTLAGAARRARRGMVVTVLCLTLLLLPQTWSYTAAWRDDEALNRYVLRRQPDSFQAAKNLGVILNAQQRYAESVDVANDMLQRFPYAWEPYEILRKAYEGLGKPSAATQAALERDQRQVRQMIQDRERDP